MCFFSAMSCFDVCLRAFFELFRVFVCSLSTIIFIFVVGVLAVAVGT